MANVMHLHLFSLQTLPFLLVWVQKYFLPDTGDPSYAIGN